MVKQGWEKFWSQSIQFKMGAIILLLIFLMMIFPSLFTQMNPYGTEPMRASSDASGHFIIQKAPFPPQVGIWLGTDEVGRHIWSLIVYGTRLTMTLAFLIVLARFAIALPAGFTAGFGGLVSKTVIRQFSLLFGAIPALLFSIILLRMPFFTQLDKNASIMAFVVVLTLVGWGRLALVIEERVAALLLEPFVQGEIALGKSGFQIALTCILRHLLPEIFVLLFLEMARALTLLLQLGLFSIFVGNIRFIEDTFKGGVVKYMNISYEPEWAGMLGSARNNISVAPWIILFPCLAFFISVMGLNAFGEGLRELLQSKTRVPISRRTLSLYRRQIIKTVSVTLILLLTITSMPYFAAAMRYKPESPTGSTEHPLELQNTPVVVGSENGKKTANWIGEELKKRGFQTLNRDSYITPYDIPPAYYAEKESIKLFYEGKTVPSELKPECDYQWLSFGNFDVKTSLVDWTKQDLYHAEQIEKGLERPGIMVVSAEFYTKEAIKWFNTKYSKLPNVKGIIWLTEMNQLRTQNMGDLVLDIPVLYMDKKYFNTDASSSITCQIQLNSGKTSGTGCNVTAFKPGESASVGDSYIVYGFSYNALTPEASKRKLDFAMSLLDALARDANNNKRSTIVTFFDGTMSDNLTGMKPYVEALPYEGKKAVLFCDLTRVEGIKQGDLLYSENQSPISRYYAYTFAIQFKERFLSEGMTPVRPVDVIDKEDNRLYLEKGIPTLIFGLKNHQKSVEASALDEESNKATATLEDLGRILSQVISRNNY